MRAEKIKKIYSLAFLFNFHLALSSYINSTFLTNIIPEKYVGVLYTISSILTLALLSKSAKILKYFGNRKLTLIFLLFNIFSLIGLSFSVDPLIIGTSFVIFTTTNTLVMFCIDIFIEHWSDKNKTGETRGLYLTIVNLAIMISPLIASLIITKEGGYKSIYLIALLLVIIMTILFMSFIKKYKDKTYTRTAFVETFKYLKKSKHMFAISMVNFLLQFFYAWMVVYTPIYLYNHLGFTWDKIGIMFTVMLIPFVIIELPIGVIIDKYNFNKKIILSIGFIIMIISTGIITFLPAYNWIIWIIILFITRVGASIVEATNEIYFFTYIGDEDASLLSIFRDMYPVAYIIAPIIATLIFLILPFKYLFITLSIIMLSSFYFISKLKGKYENKLSNPNK